MGARRPPIARSRVPLRRRLPMDPAGLRHWSVVAVAAAGAASIVAVAASEGRAAQQRWGPTRTVWVASHPLAAGDVLADAVRPQEHPVSLVPSAALEEEPGRAARAAAAIDEGAVLTSGSIAEPGADDDRRWLALPADPSTSSLAAGARVDVWAPVDPTGTAGHLDARRLATSAVVRRADGDAVVVAVAPDEVAAVVGALAAGAVVVVSRS